MQLKQVKRDNHFHEVNALYLSVVGACTHLFFCCSIGIPEPWLLQLGSPERLPAIEHQEQYDTMSGVEVESPYKATQREKEEDVEIPVIGQVSTRWVGGRGKQELIKQAEQEKNKTEVQGLKLELRTLADECKQALVVLGAETSSDPQVQKAYSLCTEYLQSSTKRKPSSLNQKMDALWKSRGEELPGALTGTPAATAILGPQLVDTILEKHKQPPDVSCFCPLSALQFFSAYVPPFCV